MARERNDTNSTTQSNELTPQPGENQVVWTIWLTYGAFYFCRTNISAAVPGLGSPVEEGGLGLSGTEIGSILAATKLMYAVGQLLNGQLSEHFSPRRLLAIGMLGSAALNVLFGFSTAVYFLLFVWACNGYAQSLGWTPCVRVIGNWVPILRRGKAIGIVGTGYQITLGLTFFIAGQSAEWFGWRAALYVPAILLTAVALFMLATLEETPHADRRDSAAQPATERHEISESQRRKGSAVENVILTLANPTLWLLGLALGLLNACRYGFLDWGISHLMTVQETGVGKAALKYVVLAIGAALGAYLSGWATDRFFGSRRAPVICILLLLLGTLTLVYEHIARTSATGTLLLLVLIGFCIYGPQVLLVGTAPADLARRGTAAAAAGFVNFMGYMGAAAGDQVTGYYKEPQHGGWEVAIYIWAGWAFTAAIVSAFLWNASGRSENLKSESADSSAANTGGESS